MHKTTAPIDPAEFDARLNACDAQVAQLQRERADALAALAGSPDQREAHQLVVQLETEIEAQRRAKARLTAAREEAARRFTAAGHTAFVQQLDDERAHVEALDDEIEAAGADFITDLVPLVAQHLQRLDDLGKQRAALVYGISRAGASTGDGRVKAQREMHRMNQVRGVGQAVVLAIRSALWHAGLGRLAPELGIAVEPPPELPGRSGIMYSTTESRSTRVAVDRRNLWRDPEADLVAVMKDERERERAATRALLAAAIEAVRAAAPGARR